MGATSGEIGFFETSNHKLIASLNLFDYFFNFKIPYEILVFGFQLFGLILILHNQLFVENIDPEYIQLFFLGDKLVVDGLSLRK